MLVSVEIIKQQKGVTVHINGFSPVRPTELGRRPDHINPMEKIDVLIIGGGPGGCAAAMFLLREGITPVILEQEEFPRFHIGESLTGEAAQVLRRLGLEEDERDEQSGEARGPRLRDQRDQ